MEKICGIYCIENIINGKKYVGQSVNVYARLRQHKSELERGKHCNQHLQHSYCRYGKNNFKFYLLEECEQQLLDELERKYILEWKLQNSHFGYNVESGGNTNKQLGESTKKKISESSKQHMQFRYLDPKEREKDSQYLLKYYQEHPEGKDVRREASLKYYHDHPETIELCRQSSIEYWNDENNRVKRSKKMTDRYKDEKERNKQRERALKVWKDETHRQNHRNGMVNSAKARPVICIETNTYFPMCSDATRWLNKPVNAGGAILNVCNGKAKTAYGYHWKFA